MEEEWNVPNYMIKQIIAGELYERRDSLLSEVKKEQNKESGLAMGIIENATQIGDMADQIRIGQIPLDQCLGMLTLDEKRNVYQKCKAWKEKNEETDHSRENPQEER